MEYDADGFAMKYSGQPLEVVKSALEKATRLKNRRNIVWSLKEIAANPLIEMLHENYKWLAHSKHPRLCDRLSHVEKVAAQSHESEPAVSGADLPFLSNYAKRGGRNVFG